MDLSIDTIHLKDSFVFFGSEGPAFTLLLFLLASRITMSCLLFFCRLCADVPLKPDSLAQSFKKIMYSADI